MSDPYRDLVRGPYARKRANTMGWTLGILAVLLLIGAGFWAMNRDGGTPNAANPPAVTASPSAAPGRPAPPPQETTGQAAPPAR
jgi:hypothetical protein